MRQHGRLNKGEQPKEYGRGDRGERRIQSVRKKISYIKNQKVSDSKKTMLVFTAILVINVKFHKKLFLSLLSSRLIFRTPGHLAKLFCQIIFRVKVFFNTWLDI